MHKDDKSGHLPPFWPPINIGTLGLLTLTMKGEKKQNEMKKDGAQRRLLKEAKSRVPEGTFILGDLRNLRLKRKFDGIWCCASLLHLRKADVGEVINSFKKMLNADGILFIALKLGEGESIKTYNYGNKRFFAYYKKAEAEKLVSGEFKIIETYVSAKDKHGDRWVEIFARIK